MLRTIFAVLVVAAALVGAACELRIDGTGLVVADASLTDALVDDGAIEAEAVVDARDGDACDPDAACGLVPEQLVGHGEHFCVRTHGGEAFCWGSNQGGELGVGDTLPRDRPARVMSVTDGGGPFVELGAGWSHTCARTADDATYCWGQNFAGQVGAPLAVMGTPLAVRVGAVFAGAVAAGGVHSCAIDHSLSVECWGDNTNGELGYAPGSRTDAGEVLVNGGQAWSNPNATRANLAERPLSLALLYRSSCALVADGGVRCWGDNTYGELGTSPSGAPVPAPQTVPLGARAIALGGTYFSACAALEDAGARCWGQGAWGNLGSPATPVVAPPRQFGTLTDVTALALGIAHSCVVASGRVRCAGWNGEGALGTGTLGGDAGCPTFNTGQTPDQCIDGITDVGLAFVVEVAATASSSCARTAAGKVYCWGENQLGQLGHAPGTNGDVSCRGGLSVCNPSPVEVQIGR